MTRAIFTFFYYCFYIAMFFFTEDFMCFEGFSWFKPIRHVYSCILKASYYTDSQTISVALIVQFQCLVKEINFLFPCFCVLFFFVLCTPCCRVLLCFVFLHVVYPVLPVSLYCLILISPSVFSSVYL